MDTHKLRILHLSDLHESREPYWRRGRVLGAEWKKNLEAVTKSCVEKGRAIDLICFTGDAADMGNADEFKRAGDFFKDILDHFGLDKDRFFIVPGNHDIDRNVAQKAWETLRRDIPRAKAPDVSKWFASDDPEKDFSPLGLDNAHRNQLMERQKAYRDWLAQFGREELIPSLARAHPRLGYSVKANLPRLPFAVNIVGLDSAWLAGDDNDAGKILLTDEQVMRHASDADAKPLPGFCLALIHHPLGDLADGADARRHLAGHVDLLLRGHLHEPEPSVWADPDRQLQQLAAGCLYSHDTYPNAFQIIDVELDEHGRPRVYEIWFRGWSKSGFWHNDDSLYRDCKDGQLTLWAAAPETKVRIDNQVFEEPPLIDISRMPQPLAENAKLVGRAGDILNLKTAFSNSSISIVAVIGPGGTGKSFLIREFLKELQDQEYDGVGRVYAWSFYDQGQHQAESSSTNFFRDALPFFGYPEVMPPAEQGRAELLSQLFRKKKNLLVLDGVETLQNPPDDDEGRFRDQAIGEFLRDVARHGLKKGGLILLTSRQNIAELDRWKQGLYREIVLTPLAREEGPQLLRDIGVDGTDEELRAASDEMGGHPLALVLLGNMLRMMFRGNISMRYELPPLIDDKKGGRQARRMMRYYDGLWHKNDAPERTFLRLLGLFGRPMAGDQLRELLGKSEFARGSRLVNLSDDDWFEMERILRDAGLAVRTQAEPASLEGNYPFTKWDDETQWDAHPIIRDYFGERLREENPSSWCEAHEVLYKFFEQRASDKMPTGADGLEPLYRAVYHGCLAAKYQGAYEIYRHRIARDDKGYDTENLGLTMSALVAMQCFFPSGVSNSPTAEISEYDQAWLLARASYCFDSAGRLDTAEGLRERSNTIFVRLNCLNEAATGYEELAVIQTRLGKLNDALVTARLSVEAADGAVEAGGKIVAETDGDNEWNKNELKNRKVRQYATRSAVATILHRQGKLLKARSGFKEAENFYCRINKNIPLHSVPGIRYCSLLLDMAESEESIREVLHRADEMLRFIDFPLMVDLHHLNKGWILSELSMLLSDEERCQEALVEVNLALDGIRSKHKIQFDCQPLLARAAVWKRLQEFAKARADLDEVIRISGECNMSLYEADAQLLLGNTILDQYCKLKCDEKKLDNEIKKASIALDRASSLISRHEYDLRLSEMHLLEARIEHARGREKTAHEALEKAKKYMEEIALKRIKKYLDEARIEIGVNI